MSIPDQAATLIAAHQPSFSSGGWDERPATACGCGRWPSDDFGGGGTHAGHLAFELEAAGLLTLTSPGSRDDTSRVATGDGLTLPNAERGDPLPAGTVILSWIVVMEMLTPEGAPLLTRRTSEGMARWTAAGFALAGADAWRASTVDGWADLARATDDDDGPGDR